MTVSGCNIIFNKNEASFVQNMIFTIERAYRTSDYGFWETGSRFSNIRELNSCSIGTAKAALEAANGLNILGPYGDPSCVLFSDPDAHYRNACALKNLLPRESFSKVYQSFFIAKEIDASLLSIIGFPSFAIDSLKLRQTTLDIIDTKLKGKLGYRRFPLDLLGIPYAKPQTADQTINIHAFANQESEWPIFYIYQAIHSLILK
ncbi:hypothetical protein MXB_2506 [Myxobolus squamalis]|nr:hypothetical protein MXB_2506 [Myxobolus squamalis]